MVACQEMSAVFIFVILLGVSFCVKGVNTFFVKCFCLTVAFRDKIHLVTVKQHNSPLICVIKKNTTLRCSFDITLCNLTRP